MIEKQDRVCEIIPQEIMLARLEQSEQMSAFFIEVWKQNPALAKQGGEKVKNLMMPLEYVDTGVEFSAAPTAPVTSKQRGISLIELIMFIVIVSSAMVGILSVMNVVSKNNADPVLHKQALAIAESLLEEIELQDFTAATGPGTTVSVSTANRATNYHIVTDYDGFKMLSPPGIFSLNDSSTPLKGLTGYSVNVSVPVTTSAWNGIPAGSWAMISVTVTPPSGDPITSVGYRTAY